MKKDTSVSKNENLVPVSPSSSEAASLKNVIEKTNNDIQKGLEMPTASTGTPIEKINGGAKFMAQLSNIGGGSVETGGGGIKEGFNTIATNIAAKSKLNGISSSDKLDDKKPSSKKLK